jgi:polysaccharide biosynthesis/export protein
MHKSSAAGKDYSVKSNFIRSLTCLLLDLLVLSPSLLMSQVENGTNLPAQAVGPSDLLQMTVYGIPELTRTIRVDPEGMIRLPMVQEKIVAQGLMPAELESRISEALVGAKVLVDPAVSIAIAEFHSRPIQVVGAVKSPLTFQAVGKTTLLEALARAQGLAEDAGEEILISHRSENGNRVERIPVKLLIEGGMPELNVDLTGGEEIRIPQAGKVFVVGNVKRPGMFRAVDGTTSTVLKALAMAEGLSPYAGKQAYVIRRADGGTHEVVIELRKILDRKTSDVNLEANDILYVPDNRSRRITMTALERAIGFASATASGALILGVNR